MRGFFSFFLFPVKSKTFILHSIAAALGGGLTYFSLLNFLCCVSSSNTMNIIAFLVQNSWASEEPQRGKRRAF